MFSIKWKRPGEIHWTTGLSTYASFQEAKNKIAVWKRTFPNNEYWVECSDFFI